MTIAVLCILDAAQSTPVSPKRSLDSTELYYLAHDSDDAASSYKPPEKKARTSSGAPSARPQQVGSPSSNRVSSTPTLNWLSSSDAYESHSWNEKQSEASISDASWQKQIPSRPRSSKAQKGTRRAGEASSSLNAGPATYMNALRTEVFDHRGRGSLTTAPGKIWHEPPEVMQVYSTKGVIKAKALAIQQHVPGYPTSPKEYNFQPSGLIVKNGQLPSQRQATGHNKHVRRTYALMAKNQEKRLPLLKGVPLMLAKDHSMDASLDGRQIRPELPSGAPLQDYRTLLSDDGKLKRGASECSTLLRSDGH